MEVHNLIGNRKYDSRTADSLVCFVEFFLNLWKILGRNSATRVGYYNLDNIGFIFAVDYLSCNNPALWCLFQRIVKHIEENLLEPVFIAVNGRINNLGFIIKKMLALCNGSFL
mgnify:CR=1 FL=1